MLPLVTTDIALAIAETALALSFNDMKWLPVLLLALEAPAEADDLTLLSVNVYAYQTDHTIHVDNMDAHRYL